MSRISQRAWYLLTVAGVFAVGVWYVGGAGKCGGFGFPLDDAWIHQTYARSLAQTGRFAYGLGQVSAGSTSPLWTLLLSLGHVLRVSPFLWTYVLGAASWLLIGWTSTALARRLFPQQRSVARWIGLACLLEWHLAWAAFSGMEIALFTFLSLLLIERYAAGAHPFWVGLIGGLLLITRPEGVVLAGLVAVVAFLDQIRQRQSSRSREWRSLASTLADMAAGLVVLLAPYVVFNEVVSGQPLPNTFYAKQAEYRALLAQPIWARLWIVLRRPLVGAQALLVPGFVWQAVWGWRRQKAGDASLAAGPSPALILMLLPVVWWGVYLVIYALRMPVDYQYGRYLMPTVPFLLIYGIGGTGHWLRPRSPRIAVRVLSRTMTAVIGCLFVAFLFVGARAYAGDVCTINGEMVDVAVWLEANTPPDALVAAHDIGAIGYFAQRPLLDLAGLITPDVIPYMRDEARLLQFVVEQEADYLATFPSWYPRMVVDDRLLLIYQTECDVTRQRGGDSMAVYQIQR